jgi:glc operon protein GlcG
MTPQPVRRGMQVGEKTMRTHLSMVLGIGFVLALASGALAQEPAPPNPPPPPPDYGPSITNEQAKAAAAAAFAEAKKNSWRMALTIVGSSGELVYFEKMDGTQLASVGLSRAKARTSVLFRRPSKIFADQYAAGNTTFTTFPERPVASEGGVPIIVGGKIVGAIGASGGTGQQDGVVATAGANAVK